MIRINLNGLIAAIPRSEALSFLKFGEHPSDTFLVACNFSDQLRHGHRVNHTQVIGRSYWTLILRTMEGGAAGATDFESFSHQRDNQYRASLFAVARWSVQQAAPWQVGLFR